MTRTRAWLGLAVFLFAAALTALIGSLSALDAGETYRSLQQPSWAPPSWLFGPVWTVLYVLIAVSGWLAWRKAGAGPHLWWYAAQLVLNAAWTPLFFGAGRYGLAFADITALWVLIIVTAIQFRPISRPAAWLLVPYLAWVTFAAALNLAILRMN